jgi:hypothetical protein
LNSPGSSQETERIEGRPGALLATAEVMPDTLTKDARQALLKQHVALEQTLKNLRTVAADPDCRPLQEAWSSFESGLLRHLALEESTVMPLYAASHPDEAHALLSEHDRIRDVVFELGLCCDLHAIRKTAVERLVRLLHAHAEHEDATLYRWVDVHATADTRRHLLRLLVNTVRAEIQADKSDAEPPRLA